MTTTSTTLISSLPTALADTLLAPQLAELRHQAERLHERVPHGTVVDFVNTQVAAAIAAHDQLEWMLAAVREANRLLAADPDEFDAV